ncbi:MAG: hypothetical protein HY828_05380 [Actinobacteria bacterium]|nr:hypothetical protein [Actinomycetota bacterium]
MVAVDEDRVLDDPRSPSSRRRVVFIVVVTSLVVGAFVVGRLTARGEVSQRWRVGRALVTAPGEVLIISPSDATPLPPTPVLPSDVAWIDTTGRLRFDDVPECFLEPGPIELRWQEVDISHTGTFPQPVIVLVDCSR